MSEFGGHLDRWLLSGEPGGAGDDEPAFYFEDAHQRCEGCSAILCLGEAPACEEGGCAAGHEEIAFSYDTLDYCHRCADETRASLAEDFAREAAHARGERCALAGCWACQEASIAISADERALLSNALRIAADVWSKDAVEVADETEAGRRLTEHFRSNARQALVLADEIEEADGVTLALADSIAEES